MLRTLCFLGNSCPIVLSGEVECLAAYSGNMPHEATLLENSSLVRRP